MTCGGKKWCELSILDAEYVRKQIMESLLFEFLLIHFFSYSVMTTRDASVTDVANGRVLLVKVQDGFTQEESLSYMANCLHISKQELPEQADQIYSESKGILSFDN